MQNQQWNIKQLLGVIALFLIMEWGMVAWLTTDGTQRGGTIQGKDQYDELLASMNTVPSGDNDDYYELLQSMNTEPSPQNLE